MSRRWGEAQTALGAAAAYDLDGNLKWVTDLDLAPGGGNPHHYLRGQFNMASPVLAGNRLVYFGRDSVTFYGMDVETGEIVWRTVSPPYEDQQERRTGSLGVSFVPRGVVGHIGPGGTPVVLDLDGTVVAVSGHGLVVRVSDGQLLGQVRFELPEGLDLGPKKGKVKYPLSEEQLYGGGYNSWTGHGNIIVGNHFRDYVVAARLSVDGDMLKQETLWCGLVMCHDRNSNLTWFDGKVYVGPRFTHLEDPDARGYSAVDALTGKVVHTGGRIWAGYLCGVGFTLRLAVARSGAWHDQSLQVPGACTFSIASMPDMKPVGVGLLCHPPQPAEVRARHIAFKGIPYLSWGVSGTTCWGNRIFMRSNDYLWCIGDPEQDWVPPERYMKAPGARPPAVPDNGQAARTAAGKLGA